MPYLQSRPNFLSPATARLRAFPCTHPGSPLASIPHISYEPSKLLGPCLLWFLAAPHDFVSGPLRQAVFLSRV